MDTELMELSCRRAAAQLEQLRIETETAELATRRTWADCPPADRSRSTTGSPYHGLQVDQDGGAVAKGSHSCCSSPRSVPPDAMLAVLQHMESTRRADQLEREAERREREAERRMDRAESEARWAAYMSSDRRPAARHLIGAALAKLPPFEGKPTQDISEYLAEFLRMTSAHEVPLAFLSNELIIKLQGNAAKWFQTAFPKIPGTTDVCPPWADLQSAILHFFTRRYTAAGAWRDLHGARRLAGTSGPEAVQRISELVLVLQHKGAPLTAGPNEQLAYLYQNQLTEEEFRQWSAAANSHSDVSDAALAALESADAADRGATSRLSCSGDTRDRWFHGRVEHLRTFLNDQARAPGGPTARAAVTTAEDEDDAAADGTATRAAGQGATAPDLVECRLRVAYGDLIEAVFPPKAKKGEPRTVSLSPPEYFGGNPKHLAANTKEFRARQEGSFCFACVMGSPRVHVLACTRHGKGASAKEREDPAGRVKGAHLPGRAY